MVSFFGLKLGSDRKKSQTKTQIKTQIKTPVKTSHTVNGHGLNVNSRDQSFGPALSPPHFTSSTARPGTAGSMRDSSNWRAVFRNRSMTGSMVDLAGPQPRRPSIGSLRCAASDMNLRSTTALPAAPGGGDCMRPGIPSRPALSNKADWVNPLDVHSCKDSPRSPLRTPHEPKPTALAVSPAQKAKSPPVVRKRLPGSPSVASSEAGDGGRDRRYASLDHTRHFSENHVIRNGYPSPTQSDMNAEGPLSPVHCARSDIGVAPSDSRNLSSSLRQVEVPRAKPLPSPAASLPGTSEERKVVPVIRTAQARRETIAFHQPRGRSLTMEFEHVPRSATTHPPKEGFSGNFADFDFGESVTKMTRSTSVQVDRSSAEDRAKCDVPSVCNKEAFLSPTTHVASLSHEQIYAAQQNQGEHPVPPASPAPTQASDDQITSSSLIDQLPEPPRETMRRPSSSSCAGPGLHQKASQGFLSSRFNSEVSSRAPPPRPLQPVTAACESTYRLEATAKSPWDPRPDNGSSSSDVGEEQAALRAEAIPPSSPFTRRPLEGKFGMSNGLPRGRRPEPRQTHPETAPDNEDVESSLSAWSDAGRSALRQSAPPAPFTPSSAHASRFASPSPGASPGASPTASPTASPGAMLGAKRGASPAASPGARTGTPTSPSATAPRIPSPTFPSLADFISTSDSTFGTAFSFDFDEQCNSPTLGGSVSMSRQPSTSAVGNTRRAEAKGVPPPPRLATLPP
ncbi:hypothetical protein E4U53_000968 [Claviceps sorghi]|nr:hypothetical protein E4U53_000968 [Claviceps sorghi]